MKTCKYHLPCGDCDKYNIHCKAKTEQLIDYNVLIGEISVQTAEDIKDKLNESLETKEECNHEWIPCGSTTIRNPTAIKSSYPNGRYKYYECKHCKKTKLEPIEECNHIWSLLDWEPTASTDADGRRYYNHKYWCVKCGETKFEMSTQPSV